MAPFDRRSKLCLSLLAIAGCLGCSRSNVASDFVQAGSGSVRDPEREHCRNVTLGEDATVARPGTILLVFDRSGSMTEPWNQRPRWEVAGEAIANALLAQSSSLTVGAVFFPSPDPTETCVDPTGVACMFVPGFTIGTGTCEVEPIEAADQIGFAPSPAFLAAFLGDPGRGTWPRYAPVMGGMTPLTEALQVARSALRNREEGGLTSVVIITDGEPNCAWDESLANEVVEGWHAAGIVTYVVGLPGLMRTAPPILDGLAETGGSGMHITPDDADAIEQSLAEIFEQNESGCAAAPSSLR